MPYNHNAFDKYGIDATTQDRKTRVRMEKALDKVEEAKRNPLPEILEPRCHVCTSKYRQAIEKMLALGISYSEIERTFNGDIERRSISSHHKKHLNYEQAAIRAIVEAEAEIAQQNFEEGIRGPLMHRAYLSTALHRAWEDLINGAAIIEPKDAIAIIQQLEKMSEKAREFELDEFWLQFNAFKQAVQEIVPPDYRDSIMQRTRELVKASGAAQLEPVK